MPGDLALLYTDALIEAADPAGKLLGESGLLEMAQGSTDRRPARHDRLEAPGRGGAASRSAIAEDDVTLDRPPP